MYSNSGIDELVRKQKFPCSVLDNLQFGLKEALTEIPESDCAQSTQFWPARLRIFCKDTPYISKFLFWCDSLS